ncbi:MAG: hypothetical protein ACYC24_05390 [Desulfobacteria bacterium]
MWKWVISYLFVCVVAGVFQRSNDPTISGVASLVILIGFFLVIRKWRQHNKAKKALLALQTEKNGSNIAPPKN